MIIVMDKTAKTTIEYCTKLCDALDDFDASVKSIAETYYAEVITPFCEKHNLKFWSGMGHYFFERLDINENIIDDAVLAYLCTHDEEDADYAFWLELGDIYTVLNKELFDGVFGYYV